MMPPVADDKLVLCRGQAARLCAFLRLQTLAICCSGSQAGQNSRVSTLPKSCSGSQAGDYGESKSPQRASKCVMPSRSANFGRPCPCEVGFPKSENFFPGLKKSRPSPGWDFARPDLPPSVAQQGPFEGPCERGVSAADVIYVFFSANNVEPYLLLQRATACNIENQTFTSLSRRAGPTRSTQTLSPCADCLFCFLWHRHPPAVAMRHCAINHGL